jgi:hypothetical protein
VYGRSRYAALGVTTGTEPPEERSPSVAWPSCVQLAEVKSATTTHAHLEP